jgi:hypothetical protein
MYIRILSWQFDKWQISKPHAEVGTPFMRAFIGAIDGNHEGDVSSRGVGNNGMHRPPMNETENETTRATLRIRIILNDFPISNNAFPNIIGVQIIASRFISSMDTDNSILALDSLLHQVKIHLFS